MAKAATAGPGSAGRARRNRADATADALATQRATTERKENELVELRAQVEEQERQLVELTKTLGARSQRVDAAALNGPAGRVANDMAVAIQKKQERRKNMLRDKLHKLQAKLDDDVAHNKSLRVDIEELRHARLHHLNAIRIGSAQVARCSSDISSMIVAAQRAYAERETCLVRLGELKRELAQEATQWEGLMKGCEDEISALESECAERDGEMAECERQTSAALATLRREEEAQTRQLEHFTAVRSRRVELTHGLEQVFSTLGVGSVAELVDAYTLIASKILSLWDKHGEQEQEVERLEEETKALQREYQQHATPGDDDALQAMHHAMGTFEATLGELSAEAKEASFRSLCESVQQALDKVPLLGAQKEGERKAGIVVNVHNVVALLGLIESAAVRTARRYRALHPETESLAASVGRMGTPKEGAPAPAERHPSAKGSGGRRGGGPSAQKPDFVPPSMEGVIMRHQRAGDVNEQVVGLGELRYGRRSLKGELMAQILGGVQTQMEKMHEEEILVKIGEKMRETTAPPTIDKGFRDSKIDGWLTKRRAPAASPVNSTLLLSSRASNGGVRPTEASPSTRRPTPPADGAGLGARTRASNTRSSPQLFNNVSGREVLDSVSRINTDPKAAQVAAAACLPRMSPGRDRSGPLSSSGRNSLGSISSASSPSLALAKGRRAIAGPELASDVPQDISELSERLKDLRQERMQIRELKQLATAAGATGIGRSLPKSSSQALLSPIPPSGLRPY